MVKDAQHLVKTIVDLTVKAGYLDDDAVVGKAVDEWIGKTFCHHFVVIVIRMTADIKNGLLNVTHLVAEQIDRDHRNGVGSLIVRHHILYVGILRTKILTETQGFCFKPGLL